MLRQDFSPDVKPWRPAGGAAAAETHGGRAVSVVCPSMSGMRGGDERSHQRKRAPALRVCLHWSYSASCYVFKERRGALIDPRIPASWSNDLSFTRRRCWTWQQMENSSKWVHINYINTFSRLLFVILAKLQRKLHGCVIWTWSFIDLIKSQRRLLLAKILIRTEEKSNC